MGERPLHLLLLVAICSTTIGCVRYARADADAGETFDPLWNRELSRFEQQIAVERHTGAADDWTIVASAWLDFVNCVDFEGPDVAAIADPAARFALATLYAEDVRRRLEVVRAATERRRINGDLLGVQVTGARFFEREAGPIPPEYIEWPAAEEDWADESPTIVDIDTQCGDFRTRVLQTRKNPDDDRFERMSFEDWLETYFSAIEHVREAYRTLPQHARVGAPARVHWTSRFHVAQLARDTARAWDAFGRRAQTRAEKGGDAEKNFGLAKQARRRTAELQAVANEHLEELVADVPEGLPDEQAGRARLLLADAAVRADRPAAALELLAAARRDGLDDRNRWGAQYLELRLAFEAARWDDAVELSGELPPPDHAVHGPYHYRMAVALKRTGQVDRFLNVAMRAFRDRPYRADPFLRALYWETLQTLAEYPFDERVIELLEEMGQRGGTFERVEEYARVALDRGRPANAEAAARWLLAHHQDARFHPRYHGIVALAAFLGDDVERFEGSMEEVVSRPSPIVEALPRNRRSTFFAHADTELARILRQMLPVMVEWGDDAAARQRRQKWLRVIVDHSQDFVRNTSDTLARPQLIELYRLASALLEEHPRGYAERVGESEPTPLVLGTVRVESRDLEAFEPQIELTMPSPYSLTLIPRERISMAEWPQRWPSDEEAK